MRRLTDIGVWSMTCISVPRGKGNRESYNGTKVMVEELRKEFKAGQKEGEQVLFPIHTRMERVGERYRGNDRREKLRELKRKWDPEGVITKDLL